MKSARSYIDISGDNGQILCDYPPPDGYYIYGLVDPRDRTLFYIGKGKNTRAWDHKYITRESANQSKIKIIQSLLDEGLEYEVVLMHHSILDEHQAYLYEEQIIDMLTNRAGDLSYSIKLTNVNKSFPNTNYLRNKKWMHHIEELNCTEEAIRYAYCEVGLSTNQMLDYLRISREKFYRYLNKYGITKPMNKRKNALRCKRTVITDGVITKFWKDSDETIPDGWRKGRAPVVCRKPKLLDKEELFRIYITENLTLKETEAYFNVSSDILRSNLRRYNIIKPKFTFKDLDHDLMWLMMSEGCSRPKMAKSLMTTTDIVVSWVKKYASKMEVVA